MSYLIGRVDLPPSSSINLQTTLAASAGSTDGYSNHHPIGCRTVIALEEDGRMACEHGYVPADDPRTQACIDQSVAILIIELAAQREGA